MQEFMDDRSLVPGPDRKMPLEAQPPIIEPKLHPRPARTTARKRALFFLPFGVIALVLNTPAIRYPMSDMRAIIKTDLGTVA